MDIGILTYSSSAPSAQQKRGAQHRMTSQGSGPYSPDHDSKACERAPDRGTKRLGSIARAHHDWHWLDWRRDAREPRVVVRAHHEESASELRAGCSMRSMMALICVIARLGGITVSLHWGGQFGVRESGEPIPAHLWGDGENNDFEAPTQGVGTARKGTSLSDPPPSPYSPM